MAIRQESPNEPNGLAASLRRPSVSGVVEIVEDRLIEQFIAHSPIERFADPVLHGLDLLPENWAVQS
jgi:hypothetical protein